MPTSYSSPSPCIKRPVVALAASLLLEMNLLRFPLLAVLLLSPSYSQLTPTDTGLTCKKGEYNNGNVCLPCPSGTISTKPNTFKCQKCPPALYPNPKRTRCVPCKNGYRITPDGDCTRCEIGSYSRANATSCTYCPPDKPYTQFKGSWYRRDCFGCPAGTYFGKENGYSFGCSQCRAGTYQPHRNRKQCIPCPKGTETDFVLYGARLRSDCVPCQPGYQSKLGNYCRFCPLDAYAPSAGFSKCLKCPLGSTRWHDGQRCKATCDPKKDAACQACPPGKMLSETRDSDGKKQCQRCNWGTYNPIWSSTECTRCLDKRKEPNTARTECICKNRFVRPSETSDDCYACPKGATRVDEFTCACPAGKVYDPVFVDCNCPPLYKKMRNGTCVKCTAGEIQTHITSAPSSYAICNFCTEGEIFSEEENRCVLCERGTTSKPGDKKCTECSQTHIADDGKKSCGCPPGHELKGGECRICKAGTFYNIHFFRCYNCNGNKFSDVDGLNLCKDCPPGRTYSRKRRLTQCPPPCQPNAEGKDGRCRCKKGFIEVGTTKNFTCVECPEGFESDRNRWECICKKGSEKVGSKCVPCKAGTIGKRPGSGCTKCPRNYISEGGSSPCTKCTEGTSSVIMGGTKCRKCPVGWFVTKNATCSRCASGFRVRIGACVKCKDGFISRGGSVAFCTPCEKGKVPNANGSRCITPIM